MLTIRLNKTIQTITFLALGCAYSNIIASNKDVNNYSLPLFTETAEVNQYPYSSTLLMGQLYEGGQREIKKNLNKAESYYLIAAMANNIDAQLALGEFYLNKNKPLQGYLFFSLAADNGDIRALSLKDSITKNLTSQELALAPDFITLIKQEISNNQLPLVSMNSQ